MSLENIIVIGPVGTNYSGRSWNEKGKTELVQIFVSHSDNRIDSIQFQYAAVDGTLVLSDRYGSTSNQGSKFDAVRLDYPDEYITWISGKKDRQGQLCSIIFGTNNGEYGPFGSAGGTKDISFRLGKDPQFYGFHGHADDYSVTSIGVYLNPITTLDLSPKRKTVERTESKALGNKFLD